MATQIRGVIEGFYGRPWTWDERLDVMRHGATRGMTHYVYAPKDDPLHRARWREPYEVDALDAFERLVRDGGAEVGFALSPGLTIDYASADDRAALGAKIDQVVARGIGLVCLALDDIPVRPGLGEDHAALTTWLHEHLAGRAGLVLVPTEYTGTRSTPYLDALASSTPADVPIAWTGPTVVCDEITARDARSRAAALGGRAPLVWDNYPVNDATMADRLFLGPLRGRGPDLLEHCDGWLANPLVQPRASRLPLASVAAYLRGEDPGRAWADEAGDLLTFAEACDGEHPRRLVGDLVRADGTSGWPASLQALRAWLAAAEGCAAPGLDGEVDAWLEQVHHEATLGLTAVRALERLTPNEHRPGPPDVVGGFERGMLAAVLWQQAKRAEVSVMGPRLSVRPVIRQDDDGAWVFERSSVAEDASAIDALMRLMFDVLARGA